MRHNRYNFSLPNKQNQAILDANKPIVFIDKVTARIACASPVRVRGNSNKPNFIPDYRWFNTSTGKIGVWGSGLNKDLFVTFNPSTLAMGYNVFPFRASAFESLMHEVLPEVHTRLPRLPVTRRELTSIRAGHSEMSEIHLTADFEFPSIQKFNSCFRDMRLRWASQWNKIRKDYDSSFYLLHTHWDFLFYNKDDEIYKKHGDWPDAVRQSSRNRLRIELRLRRQALLTLERRLLTAYPGLPHLTLSQVGDWEPNILPLVYDCYLSRLAPKGKKIPKSERLKIPLYRLIAHHGGLPVYPRGDQTETSYYHAPPKTGGLPLHRNPKVFPDKFADHWL